MVRRIPGTETITGGLSSVTSNTVVMLVVLVVALSAVVSGATVTFTEDWEDGDLSGWTGDTGSFTVNQSAALNGQYGVAAESNVGGIERSSEFKHNATEFTYLWEQKSFSTDGDDRHPRTEIQNQTSGADLAGIHVNDTGGIMVGTYGNHKGTGMSIQTGVVYQFEYHLNYTSQEYHVEVYRVSDNTQVGVSDTYSMEVSTDAVGNIDLRNDNGGMYRADDIGTADQATDKYQVSGEVVDSDNSELSGVDITVNDSSGSTVATDTTGELGKYSVTLENGTYNITASKENYTSETKQVTVSGSDETVDFQLTEFNQSITLDTRMFMEHGQRAPYEVVVEVNGDRRGVTENATVTSGNSSVVTIDDTEHEVVATNDTSVNQRTYVQAEWTDDDGNTYTTRRNVTVANATVENVQILPDFTRFTASISDDTIFVIIIATGVGSAAALFATSFAGVSAVTMVMLLGWLAGYVNNGMAILAVLAAMFIGMNVAGNVDYTVRR